MATLADAITHLLAAKRISAASQSYAKDNPAEWSRVKAYLNGGTRPSVSTEMGMGLVEVEDVRRGVTPPPPPPPPLGNPSTSAPTKVVT
jgi:hypothetical protein